jgi:hypothetical protein
VQQLQRQQSEWCNRSGASSAAACLLQDQAAQHHLGGSCTLQLMRQDDGYLFAASRRLQMLVSGPFGALCLSPGLVR